MHLLTYYNKHMGEIVRDLATTIARVASLPTIRSIVLSRLDPDKWIYEFEGKYGGKSIRGFVEIRWSNGKVSDVRVINTRQENE